MSPPTVTAVRAWSPKAVLSHPVVTLVRAALPPRALCWAPEGRVGTCQEAAPPDDTVRTVPAAPRVERPVPPLATASVADRPAAVVALPAVVALVAVAALPGMSPEIFDPARLVTQPGLA